MTTDTSLVEQQLVVFDLGSESYGVDIGKVREIIRMQEITAIPQTSDFVEGMINLRGMVIPVVDLSRRFGLPPRERTDESRTVVVDISGHSIGMVVDAVREVLRISSDAIEPPSAAIKTDGSSYLLGIAKVGDRLIILLDLEQVLNTTDWDAIEELATAA